MKKIILTSFTVLIWGASFSQDSCDYNPYQHSRENFIETGQGLIQDYKNRGCDNEFISNLIQTYYTDTIIDKNEIFQRLSTYYCPDLIPSFLENIIQNDTSNEIKFSSIIMLGWYNPEKSVPWLLSYITSQDKTKKLKASGHLCALGKYDLAITLLNQFCYDESGNIDPDCILKYEHAGATEIVSQYYAALIHQLDTLSNKYFIATKLAEYGFPKQAYPILMEALNSGDPWDMRSALFGLAAIGDENAFRIIKEHLNNKNQLVSNTADFIISYIKLKKEEKCKK